jgi:hypothetical protein
MATFTHVITSSHMKAMFVSVWQNCSIFYVLVHCYC